VYQQETEPLLKYYQRRGLMVDIDGVGNVEEVHQRLLLVIRAMEATNSHQGRAKSDFGRSSAKQVKVSPPRRWDIGVSSLQRDTKDETPGTRGMTPRGFLGSSLD
jgi:hypothetical protein